MGGNCINKLTLMCFLSSLLYIPRVNALGELPVILDYYPNCSYQIIENAVAKLETEQPFAEDTKLRLLNKLRKKAKKLGADALILIDKNAKKVMNTKKYYGSNSADITKYEVSYEAELIKQCEAHNKALEKLAPYNHQGNQTSKTLIAKTTIITKFVFTPPVKEKLNHPVINNSELSLINGIYGIKIGSQYQHVIKVLGDPSVILSESENELILGYGRRHWFHFQSSKLVKVESELSSLSPTLLNKVPLRDFFDENPWTIANKLTRQSTLNDVKSVLALDANLNKKNQLVLKNQNNIFTLNFSYRKSDENNAKVYFLDGFVLQDSSYEKPTYQAVDSSQVQFAALALALTELKYDQDTAWQSLNVKLGQPLGRITLSATSSIDIYNSNLLIKTRGEQLTNIQLVEPLFNLGERSTKNMQWFLGEYTQGKSIEQLRALFPSDSFELDNRVEIDTELYQLTLFFDDSGDETSLYEAEMSFY
jgi:hypothetical protein